MPASTVAPAFTRRHYVAVADAIEGVRDTTRDDCREGVDAAAFALAALFSEDNERFDESRFMRACGVEITTELPRFAGKRPLEAF